LPVCHREPELAFLGATRKRSHGSATALPLGDPARGAPCCSSGEPFAQGTSATAAEQHSGYVRLPDKRQAPPVCPLVTHKLRFPPPERGSRSTCSKVKERSKTWLTSDKLRDGMKVLEGRCASESFHSAPWCTEYTGERLKSLYANARGVQNEQEEPEALAQSQSYDIIGLSETCWDESCDWSALIDSYRREGERGRAGETAEWQCSM